MVLCSHSLVAQNYQSGFFLDNNTYSYRFNPAQTGDRTFVGVGINNVNLSANGNIGISSLIYPSGNGLVTGLNSAVSSEEFLGNLKDVNRLAFDLNESVLAFGFKAGEAYHTVEFNIRAGGNASLPKDLFEFLKNGSRENPYDLSDVNVSANAFAELAYGYSRSISDNLKVGGRVKALVGLANMNTQFNKANMAINENGISYDVDAAIRFAAPMVQAGADNTITTDMKIGPSGFGAALDLGASLALLDDHLTLSAALLDLGGISWKYNTALTSKGADSFEGAVISTDSDNMMDDITSSLDKFMSIADFKATNSDESEFGALPCTINLGARYRIPQVEMLSVGLLSTVKTGNAGWYDLRAGATVTPVKWFSLACNAGVNSFGTTVGAAASITALCANIALGIESSIGPAADLGAIKAPLNPFRTMANLGISFVF